MLPEGLFPPAGRWGAGELPRRGKRGWPGPHRPLRILAQFFFSQLHRSGADGAAGGSFAGAGIDGGFPHMALAAAPPHLLLAAAGDGLWPQIAVQLRVPLLRHLRGQGGKVVKPRPDPPARAVGAAAAALFGAGVNGGLPGVALFALPPDHPALAAGDIHGGEGAVKVRAPLFLQRRHFGGDIRLPHDGELARAIGAAAAGLGEAEHLRTPAMTAIAPPPDSAVGAGGDIPGR